MSQQIEEEKNISSDVKNGPNKSLPASEYYTSDSYTSLIPKNADWIDNPLKITLPVSDLLDGFVIPDESHPYLKDIEEAMALFNKWRKIPDSTKSAPNHFVQKSNKNNVKIYKYSLPNEPIDIVKGEVILSYTSPIIAGVLNNINYNSQWSPNIRKMKFVEQLNQYSDIYYAQGDSPVKIISARDLLFVKFSYRFNNGTFIIGYRSIKHDKYPPVEEFVRGFINLQLFLIEPYGDNLKESKLTFYSHLQINGNIPYLIINSVGASEVENRLQNIRDLLDTLKKSNQLHLPGVLHIPYDSLKLLNLIPE